MKRAVFLDRDGTLNVDKVYLSDPSQVELFPGAISALKRLQQTGYLLFIVTNQSGVGRGYYSLDEMHRVNERVIADFAAAGVRFEKSYFAPEAPEEPSRGRKPSPQFLFDARDEFGVDLSRSFMVGDKLADVECGTNACVKKSLLVRTGYGATMERDFSAKITGAVVVNDIAEAADWILQNGG